MPYGVQNDQLARVPARIAILPCRPWPQGALLKQQSKLTLPPTETQSLCQKFDQFVVSGFDGQPFMRGISPKLVGKLLEQAQKPDYLAKLDELWYRPGQACEKCDHAAQYYQEAIYPRQDWREWLTGLSRATSLADAILLPLIFEAELGTLNDRGLKFGYRKAFVLLLLIDTNNGELIWVGGRQSEARLAAGSEQEAKTPAAEELFQNLFINNIWIEFPGRQTT